LVGYSIERQAIHVAAGHLNKLQPAELKKLSEAIDRLPAATTARQVIMGEKEVYLEWLIRTLSQPGGKETMLRLGRNFGERRFSELPGLSQEQLREGAIALRPVYDKLAEIVELPLPEAQKAEKELMAGDLRGSARAVSQTVLPAAVPVRQVELGHLSRLAMLKAAIAVCLDGEAVISAEAHLDPYDGEPFQYQKTPQGFRLQSKVVDGAGNPVVLEVGIAGGK
jgi:hypothetical protein